MIKSLYSGVTGLKSHNTRMDVIGNNIANVNTTAYKGSTVTFKDVYYQTKSQPSGGDATSGGVNPKQIGYGVKVGTINQVMTQSGLTYSDSIYDCALEGDGFFQVMDPSGNILYTRNGVFEPDNAGNLKDANGNIVLGVMGDPTGVAASSQRIRLVVPDVQDNAASITTAVVGGYEVTISAAGYGPEGNLSLSFSNSDTPYATYSNYNLKVQLDLENIFNGIDEMDFESDYEANMYRQQVFEDAVNTAIRAGGVNLPDNVIPLSISFDSLPSNTNAVAASNIMEFTKGVISEDTERFAFKFTAVDGGEFANKYEINMKGSSTATEVTAKWSENVLTVTVPNRTDEDGNLIYDFTMEDIQKAIWVASGAVLDDSGELIESEVEINGVPIPEGADLKKALLISIPTVDEDGYDGLDIEAADLVAFLDTTKKVSLSDGSDNFFNKMATSLGTVILSGGRYQEAQTHQHCTSIYIGDDGVIYGEHPVHGTILFGRIDLATFENSGGLTQSGTSYWKASSASGDATVKRAGEDGAALIVSGALEMSNIDLSQEFSDMIITQRGFQANSRIITVSDTMLEELINLKR